LKRAEITSLLAPSQESKLLEKGNLFLREYNNKELIKDENKFNTLVAEAKAAEAKAAEAKAAEAEPVEVASGGRKKTRKGRKVRKGKNTRKTRRHKKARKGRKTTKRQSK